MCNFLCFKAIDIGRIHIFVNMEGNKEFYKEGDCLGLSNADINFLALRNFMYIDYEAVIATI